MRKELIETRPCGICNFDYFCADLSGAELSLGDRTFPLGQITLDVMQLSGDFVGELLARSDAAARAGAEVLENEYSEEALRCLRKAIFDIFTLVKAVPPFSYFDVADSRRSVEQLLSDRAISEYTALFRKFSSGRASEADRMSETAKRYSFLPDFARVYCYLGSDTVNFSNFARNLTELIVACDARTPGALAEAALTFCTDEKTATLLQDANPFPYTDGVSFRPLTSAVPAIPMAKPTDVPKIVRRTYFARLMDFFMADLMGALEVGHYVYRCRVCGGYFLMTSAHRQYYCQTIHPQFGVPCANVAKNRKYRTAESIGFRQLKKDSPLTVLYKRQCAVIRKRKQRKTMSEEEAEQELARLKACFKKASIDPDYAETQFEADLKNV